MSCFYTQNVYSQQIEKVEEFFSWTPEAAISQNIMALSAASLSTVPVRHLPPGKPMALYWQFQSWCEAAANCSGRPNNVKTPSWSTFWRAWSDKWSYVLKFRKKSQHKECTDCFTFRESISGVNIFERRCEVRSPLIIEMIIQVILGMREASQRTVGVCKIPNTWGS